MSVDVAVSTCVLHDLERRPASGPRVTRVHFGSEFCERLVPTVRELREAVATTRGAGKALTLLTPMACDETLGRLRDLFAVLPDATEVVANEWGVLRVLSRDHPALVPVAGRRLCRMIKDPRLPSADWTRVSPHGVAGERFLGLLESFGVRRIELDVPPFASAADLHGGDLMVSAHAPYGYAASGRICPIGCLQLPRELKFTTGHACSRECLSYESGMSRGAAGREDLATIHRGNTLFYEHSRVMARVLGGAIRNGIVDRVVIPGERHAHRGTA